MSFLLVLKKEGIGSLPKGVIIPHEYCLAYREEIEELVSKQHLFVGRVVFSCEKPEYPTGIVPYSTIGHSTEGISGLWLSKSDIFQNSDDGYMCLRSWFRKHKISGNITEEICNGLGGVS